MADLNDPRMAALAPLTARVRRDVTAVKRGGRQSWTDEPLTKLRLAQHLNGGPARGVCPIKPGESVTMVGLYDLDSHGGVTSWDRMAVTGAALVDQLVLAWGCGGRSAPPTSSAACRSPSPTMSSRLRAFPRIGQTGSAVS